MLLLAQGCAQPDSADLESDDATELQQAASESSASAEFEEDLQVVAALDGGRSNDAGVTDGGVKPDAAAAPAARPTSLTFRMTTAPFGGRYAPKNIGAIWVETSTGTFVKTLKRWARIRARYLTRFATASKNDLTDAISGATLANHRTPHEVKWNLTDRTKVRVKDGQYRLAIELTDRDGPGALLYIPFTVGAAPVRLTPAATKEFLGMELKLE